MKKLLIVAEYWDSERFLCDTGKSVLPDTGKFFTAEEPAFLCTKLEKMHSNVIVADPFRTGFDKEGKFIALEWGTGEERMFDINQVGVLYFLTTCKRNDKADVDNDLTSNMETICRFLEGLKPHEGKLFCINPVQTIISTISKQYILDLISEGCDFMIPTFEVMSVEELQSYAERKDGKDWVAKPKISERANHVNIITDGSWGVEQLRTEYASMLDVDLEKTTGLYKDIMLGQGVIVQEFQKGFIESGEIKVTVLGNKIIHARRTIPSDSSSLNIAAKNGGFERWELSDDERDFVRMVVDVVNKKYKAHALRIDIVKSDAGGYLVSEIEAVNQSYAARYTFLYADGELEEHFEKLIPGKYLE